ncbi:unnamed protein product [Linum trigynum]|uniref:Uncharacterized protein n=1 Tax=Linum trigynum TaxID=586398 RepID=A0AAV2DZK4_9ROSI
MMRWKRHLMLLMILLKFEKLFHPANHLNGSSLPLKFGNSSRVSLGQNGLDRYSSRFISPPDDGPPSDTLRLTRPFLGQCGLFHPSSPPAGGQLPPPILGQAQWSLAPKVAPLGLPPPSPAHEAPLVQPIWFASAQLRGPRVMAQSGLVSGTTTATPTSLIVSPRPIPFATILSPIGSVVD